MDKNVKKRIEILTPHLNECQKRMYLALEADSIGRGGIKAVSAISGVHRNTISAGLKELNSQSGFGFKEMKNKSRARSKGGGRKPVTEAQPGILDALHFNND